MTRMAVTIAAQGWGSEPPNRNSLVPRDGLRGLMTANRIDGN
jgi:hypothetical protein